VCVCVCVPVSTITENVVDGSGPSFVFFCVWVFVYLCAWQLKTSTELDHIFEFGSRRYRSDFKYRREGNGPQKMTNFS